MRTPRLMNQMCTVLFLTVLPWTAEAAAPASPSALRAKEVSAGIVALSWKDRSFNETKFELQRGTSAQSLATIAFPAANTTGAGDTIPSNATRLYRIRASNLEGNSAWSNLCWLNANPPRPTGLAVVQRNPNVTLSWGDNSSNEKGFRIQRRTSGVTSFATIANVGANVTGYVDTSVDTTSTYEYRVRANGRPKICIANSRWSNVVQSVPVLTGTRTLTVTKSGSGSGTVTGNPSGISCGSQCSANHPTNTTVTLTATPAAGSTFAGWSGACAGTSTQCLVMLNIDKNVGARFDTIVTGCPTNGPLLDLRRNCANRGYFYESSLEIVELVTNGSTIFLTIEDKAGELPTATLSGDVTSATTFHYDEACIPGIGCAPVDDDGAILNSGQTLRLELSGQTFNYSFDFSAPTLVGSVDGEDDGSGTGDSLLDRLIGHIEGVE